MNLKYSILNYFERKLVAFRRTRIYVNFIYFLAFFGRLVVAQEKRNNLKVFLYDLFPPAFKEHPIFYPEKRPGANLALKKLYNYGDSNRYESISVNKYDNIFVGTTIDLIIPIYDGYQETISCIKSVLESRKLCKTNFRLILINDCSPNPRIVSYLKTISNKKNIYVLHNKKNLGFTQTVNIGMSLSENHILILNSDTVVANNWLDRLVNHHLNNELVGTITPFSNNGTICNYPPEGFINFPNGETLESIDNALSIANKNKNHHIPTGVGFCMFISRFLISKVGNLNVELFKKGYGEENDLCLRASNAGFSNLIACDVFVYHKGEVSFKKSSVRRKEKAGLVIDKLHPHYNNLIRNFVMSNPLKIYRTLATIQRLGSLKKRRIIQISHQLGGGTAKYIDEISVNKNAIFIRILFNLDGSFKVETDSPSLKLSEVFENTNNDNFVELVRTIKPNLIHINHTMGIGSYNLELAIDILNIPFIYTAHDFYSICPRVFMVQPNNEYCKELGIRQCQKCLSDMPFVYNGDIISWRMKNSWLFNNSKIVLCPSNDTMVRIKKYFPNAKCKVVTHETITLKENKLLKNKISKKRAISIALFGAMTIHKGKNVLQKLLDLIQDSSRNDIHIYQIGSVIGGGLSFKKSIFTEYGEYHSDSELNKVIKHINPQIVLFLSICPETFSYTLTNAIKNNLFIIAPNLGSFRERLAGYEQSFIFDPDSGYRDIFNFIINWNQNLKIDSNGSAKLNKFYLNEYIDL